MAQMSSTAFLDTRNFDFALIRDMDFFRFANDRPSSFEPGELPGLTESWPVTDGAAYWAGNAKVNLADVAIILGGDNLTLGSGNALTGGTISGMVLAEETTPGGAIFYIANTSISALTVQAAINTTSTADDMAVVRLMLVSDDLITGTNQNDYVEAWKGDDTLTGGNGRDTLDGESGKDSISGDAGNDSILGGNGSDTLSGGIGNDTVSGGAGSDRFLSDEGSDFLNAGADTSRDTFIFTAVEHSQTGSYRDVIVGFTSGTDVLDLRQINADVFSGADQKFTFSATGPAANSIWLVTKSSGISVFADVSGNLTADFEILLKDISALSASDMLL